MTEDLRIPLNRGGDEYARWRGAMASYVYASAGNVNAMRAERSADLAVRSSLMRAAVTCWSAAIARGFVCC